MADPSIAPAHHHRNLSGGAARAAVFGVQDGLVTNVALILGVAGADPGQGFVRLAGVASLIAGAVSMAAGEYNSMQVQRELMERELELERQALHRFPAVETVELAQIYQSKGMEADQARQMAEQMMRDPERALEVHALEELGISPEALGLPLSAATSSFAAFSLGALVPLVPWFFIGAGGAIATSIVLAAVAALVVGVAIARTTDRRVPRAVLRQLAFTLLPAAMTFLIGNVVGVNVG
jgi:VIT1/CCC1 family predicted Fe2+/Mn2+ transporter